MCGYRLMIWIGCLVERSNASLKSMFLLSCVTMKEVKKAAPSIFALRMPSIYPFAYPCFGNIEMASLR